MAAKKIRVGVLGLGRSGQTMHFKEIERFPELYELVAGCDNDPERREAALKRQPGLAIYGSISDFLKDPNIDLVTVATRSPDHVQHAIRALEAGKYVFCEKPICCDYEEALRLKRASDRFPGKLFIRHNRRFETAFSHIREIIATGKLGNIYEVKLRRQNFQWRADWQTIQECGGGQLLNWGPHLIDHALQFLESPVVDVWSDLKLVAALGDAEDHLKIVLRGANHRIVDVEISGGSALSEAVYFIHGSRGTLVSQDEKTIKMKYLTPGQEIPAGPASAANPPLEGGFGSQLTPQWTEEEIEVNPASGDYIEKVYQYVYEGIMGIRPYPVTIDQALEVVRITDIVKKQKVVDVR